MNYKFSEAPHKGTLILTDFNCASFEERFGSGEFYKVIWAKEQNIELQLDHYDFLLKENQVLFCTPNNMVQFKPYIKGVLTLIFDKEFYCLRDHDFEVSCTGSLFGGSSSPANIQLSSVDKKDFELIFMFLEDEFKVGNFMQAEMLLVLLKRLLIKSVRLLKTDDLIDSELDQPYIEIIRQYNLLVESNFKEKHKVADYAAILNKSPKTLSNLFARYNYKTPSKVINDRIILEAKKLLLYSNKSSKEIAFILGFSEASHFSKYFKNHVGASPKMFKKNNNYIF